MNIVMISPGYPAEMAYFTRALAAVGATVIGVGDQPPSALPDAARDALAHYEHVTLTDEGAMLGALHGLARHVSIDQVECLWEPYMILAARIRESFGVPGMTVEQTVPFRDKERMKQAIDAAGIRTPWHVSATTVADVWEAAERVGYPLIVKPIDGAGSADTYRVDSAARAGRRAAAAAACTRGQRGGVHRRGGVHLRHGLRGRIDPVRERYVVPASAVADEDARMDQPGVDHAA